MTIGVAHDPVTAEVVLVDRAQRAIYSFALGTAADLADRLRTAAGGGCSVLITVQDDAGLVFQIGGSSDAARQMAGDIERNAAIVALLRSEG